MRLVNRKGFVIIDEVTAVGLHLNFMMDILPFNRYYEWYVDGGDLV